MSVMTEQEAGLVRLDRLGRRTCAVVRRIDSGCEDIERLKTLGVCAGRQIEVVKDGDPMILRVFSSRIGMSGSLAESVWVDACSPEHCAMREHPCR